MRRALLAAAALASLASLVACDVRPTFERPAWSLERMIDQPRVGAYEQPMRSPPPGTVPADLAGVDPIRLTGVDRGAFVARIPIALTRDLLARGKDRFEVACATCHGILGDGDSVVAEKMAFRRPPSLLEARVARSPDGRIFAIATNGYGVMPSYRDMLTPDDRWAVVAYVRALERSRAADLASLPLALRREATERAR